MRVQILDSPITVFSYQPVYVTFSIENDTAKPELVPIGVDCQAGVSVALGPDYRWIPVAMETVLGWRFEPGTLDGAPVEVRYVAVISKRE